MIDLGITTEDVDEEVRGALDTTDPEVDAWVSKQINKATRRLLATCPTLESRLRNNQSLADIAKDIVVEAVARMARMDDDAIGIKSESEGEYSYSVDPLTRSGNIWFPDKDLALLGCGTADTSSFVPRSASLTHNRVWAGF